jgi:hypothetical protein
MNWKAAFLVQARSEDLIRRRLDDPAVEPSHRLHYLQMVTEKLAKGLLATDADSGPPTPVHRAFVRLLQTLKDRSDIRRRLGFSDRVSFRRFIVSLLSTAEQIENLAPSAPGFTRPNPEYPWLDPATGQVQAPCDYLFPLLNPRNRKMIQLESLIGSLVALPM